MPVDTTAIRFRLLRSYRLGTANDSEALDAACQDVAALCARVDELERERDIHAKWSRLYKWTVKYRRARHKAADRRFMDILNRAARAERENRRLGAEVDRLAAMYEPDMRPERLLNVVGVPQESIRDVQRLRELD